MSASAIMSAAIHLGTFVSSVLWMPIMVPVGSLFLGGACLYQSRNTIAHRSSIAFGFSLHGVSLLFLAYAAIVFFVAYRSKAAVHAISATEQLRIQILSTRMMSAWLLAIAVLGLSNFIDRSPSRAS